MLTSDSATARILFHKLDITDEQSINDIYDWIVEYYGRLDILVNNAGIYLD
jgi:NAD(P)-dependent dehydrogenase (short-subunit alcohol dehydrogenase family)